MAQDLKYGDVDIPGVPDDEPVFILRARDVLSEATISDYQALYAAHARRTLDTNDEEGHAKAEAFISSLRRVRTVFTSWQSLHAKTVRTPD